MKSIPIEKIIGNRKLNPKEIAALLFPSNGHAMLALKRVMKGEGVLDANQMQVLATHLGVSTDALYNDYARDWEAKTDKKKHRFVAGDWEAVLDCVAGTTSIFLKGKLAVKEVLHAKEIELSEYLNLLNNQIQIFQNEYD